MGVAAAAFLILFQCFHFCGELLNPSLRGVIYGRRTEPGVGGLRASAPATLSPGSLLTLLCDSARAACDEGDAAQTRAEGLSPKAQALEEERRGRGTEGSVRGEGCEAPPQRAVGDARKEQRQGPCDGNRGLTQPHGHRGAGRSHPLGWGRWARGSDGHAGLSHLPPSLCSPGLLRRNAGAFVGALGSRSPPARGGFCAGLALALPSPASDPAGERNAACEQPARRPTAAPRC